MMKGYAHVYHRNDINTDEILPARYMNQYDEQEMGRHCLADLDQDFINKVRTGDFIIAGHNFGCGSSREHAIWALRGAGVQAVLASSFARIFMRNAINNGFLVIEAEDLVSKIDTGAELEIDPLHGVIKNLATGDEFRFHPLPQFALDIVNSGGLLEYVKMSG